MLEVQTSKSTLQNLDPMIKPKEDGHIKESALPDGMKKTSAQAPWLSI